MPNKDTRLPGSRALMRPRLLTKWFNATTRDFSLFSTNTLPIKGGKRSQLDGLAQRMPKLSPPPISIGTDICHIPRIRRILEGPHRLQFVQRLLNVEEIREWTYRDQIDGMPLELDQAWKTAKERIERIRCEGIRCKSFRCKKTSFIFRWQVSNHNFSPREQLCLFL